MKILGIETSADDTGIALIDAEGNFGPEFKFRVLANERISQSSHQAYGGIYPNLAKEEHKKNLPIAFERAISGAPVPDAIAVTVGPGLEPCLWQGIEFAKKLAIERSIPIVPVNHMEGHVLISMMHLPRHPHPNTSEKNEVLGSLEQFEFPVLALLISGGHTELILMREFGQYEYIGRTRDDAAGEAFDKVARMLGLPYPGGPAISALAEIARNKKQETTTKLPRPMMHENNFDFSFAGLKTAVSKLVVGHELSEKDKRQIAREFEDAVADVLVHKTLRAVDEYGANTVVIGGGVSANARIRDKFSFWAKESGLTLLLPSPEFSTDNGLMIALAGYFHALKKDFATPEDLRAQGNLMLA